ncbi:MAG: TRAP transporter substrate-binding protein DctP [Bradyrhizobium sp.]|uniref:TRAP transporter substrate-binding protein DctP n=1 Tax=Bradyrhizobium sp. TaxID=376 RepID=UPI003D0B86D4
MKLKCVIAALAALAAGSLPATAATKMRCSHQLPPPHHIAKVIDRWAEEVRKNSDGELDVQVFGASSLVDATKNITAVAKGEIECAFSLNFQWGKTLPIMDVTLAPFAFGDLTIWRKWAGSEPAKFLEQKLLAKGVRNVVWMFQSNTTVFTSKGQFLIKPEDFKGKKIRGLNRDFDAALAALGAVPTAMPGNEVYQALSTGVLDAGLTDAAAAVSRKYYEVQDHFTVLPVVSAYLHGYVNPKWYDGLSDKAKTALQSAGNKAAVWAVEASEEAGGAAPKQLEAKGVKVHVNTAAENKAIEAVMRPAFDAKFSADADSKKLIELIGKM